MSNYEIFPTLVVGLGGTGHEVLTHLRAKMLDAYGTTYRQAVRLLAFDTDQPTTMVMVNKVQRREKLVRDEDFVYIGGVEVSEVINNRPKDKEKDIYGWLPTDLPTAAVTSGAGQVRALGRLCWQYHYPNIRSHISNALSSLKHIKTARGSLNGNNNVEIIDNPQSLNVFLVSSVCGGTGSGIFIDAAYLIRDIALSRGLIAAKINLVGFLMLPDAFPDVQGERIKPNAFAALKELEHFMGDDSQYIHKYESKSAPVSLSHVRPFDICYLVDGVNENQWTLGKQQDLAPIIADSIFLQFSERSGAETKSVFVNIQEYTTHLSEAYNQQQSNESQGKLFTTAYSGMGTSQLVFPADKVIEICTARLLDQLLSKVFLGRPSQDRKVIAEEVQRFEGVARLEPRGIMEALILDEKTHQPLSVRLNSETLKSVEPRQYVTFAQQMTLQVEQQLATRYTEVMQNNQTRYAETVENEFQKYITDLLNNPNYGITFCQDFLKILTERIDQIQRTVDQGRQDTQNRMNTEMSNSQQRQSGLQNFKHGFLTGGKALQLATDFLNFRQNAYRERLRSMQLDFTRTLLTRFLNIVRQWQQQVDKLLAMLNNIVQLAQHRDASTTANFQSGANPLVTYIINEADVSEYYSRYTTQNHQNSLPQLFSSCGEPDTWINLTIEELNEKLHRFAAEQFKALNDQRVEEILREKAKARLGDVTEYLIQLEGNAAPFWNIAPARIADGAGRLERSQITIIGVEDETQSIFAQRGDLHNKTLVSTEKPHIITVLKTKHGLPLYALRQYYDWENAYEYYRNNQRFPLHIFHLGDEKHGKVSFGLGLVFEYIRKKPSNTYDFAENRKDAYAQRPVTLGQGLEKSLDYFLSTTQLIEHVMKLSMQQIDLIGQIEAKQRIEQFIHSGVLPANIDAARDLVSVLREWTHITLR